MLEPGRWRRVEEVFHHAADLPATERVRYVVQACPDDTEIQAKVLELLAADDGPDMASAAVQQAVTRTWEGRSSMQAGPYRLIRQIGRGGMGSVYLGARADEQFEKQVAVKILGAGWDARLMARFRQERQILARLEHPHIARLLDGGITDAGHPFVVMEYVDGQPLTDWCREKDLSLADRLVLFRDVCEAVQYAHRNLIIHRDLKPGNILVTTAGQVKLLDFGIAKITGNTNTSEPLTREGELILTPQYASPEQIAGRTVDTAADIYSLGVILFELLTGRRPFDDDDLRTLAMMVVTQDAPRPSRVAPPAVAPALMGDLDNIILKALRKEPAERYHSAEQLSEDVRRYQEDLPILASSDTWTYHARKFARRHRGGVALVGGLLLAIIGLSIFAGFKAREAQQQRDQAITERDNSRQLAAFLTGVFASADAQQSGSRDIKAGDLLERGAREIGAATNMQPPLRASMLDAMAAAFLGLGAVDRAEALSEQAVGLRATGTPESLAESLTVLSGVRVFQGKFGEATDLARRAVALSPATRMEPRLALERALFRDGKYEECEQLLRTLLREWKQRREPDTPMTIELQLRLGNVIFKKGDPAQAERHFRLAYAMAEKLFGHFHYQTATALATLADAMRLGGRQEEALALRKQVVAIDRVVLGDGHPALSDALQSLASAYLDNADWQPAEPLVEEMLRIRIATHGRKHVEVAQGYQILAWMLDRKGDAKGSLAAYDDSIAILRELYGETHVEVAEAYAVRAMEQRAVQDFAAMEADSRRMANVAAALPDGKTLLANARMMQAAALYLQAKLSQAEATARESLDLLHRYAPGNSRTLVSAGLYLAESLLDQNRPVEAKKAIDDALEILTTKLPAMERNRAGLLNVKAAIHLRLGDRVTAAKLFAESTPLLEKYRKTWVPKEYRFFEQRYQNFAGGM